MDLGTSGVKLALVTVEGEIMASAVEPLEVRILPGGGAEQDPETWWVAIVRAAHRVMAEAGVDPSDVVGAGCSSQGSRTIPLDAEGRHLMNRIIWMDSRGPPPLPQGDAGV